jgi:hypothetical protein
LPVFLQDSQDDVEASLVGWSGNQPNQSGHFSCSLKILSSLAWG